MKKIFSTVNKIILLVIIGLLVWYNLPQQQEAPFSLLPEKALGYGQITVNWNDKGPRDLFNIFWQKFVAANPRLNNGLARQLALSWLPQQVAFAVIYDQQYATGKRDPDVIAVIREDKKTRLLKLLQPWVKELNSLQIKNNVVIISSSPDNLPAIKPEKLITINNILLPLTKTNLEFYLPNREQQLTSLVRAFEQKNNFSLFPSIATVDYLELNGKLVDASQFQGKMTFVGKHIYDVDKIGMDAIFLNNLILRFMLGYGFDYQGEVNSLANYVTIDYKLNNLDKVWSRFK